MDHLLLPLNPTLPPITIPFVTTIPTSPLGDFLTFPDRQGFRAFLNNPKPDLSSSSIGGLGPSIQKWLFFGLLEAVTRISRPTDYVRAAPGGHGRVITTASLYEHVEKRLLPAIRQCHRCQALSVCKRVLIRDVHYARATEVL
jgi:hypothetical protein